MGVIVLDLGYHPSTGPSKYPHLNGLDLNEGTDLHSTPSEQLHQLSHSSVSLIFTTPALLPNLKQAFKLASTSSSGFSVPQDRIVLLTSKATLSKDLGDYVCLEEITAEPMDPERFENGAEHETVIMCYSSGTVRISISLLLRLHHNELT